MTIALCPGSYDPVTRGHMDIIRRSAAIFEKVIVLVLQNRAKTPTFSVEQRVEFIRRAAADMPNVVVDSSMGLLVDYAKEHNARIMVKGLRAVTDFEEQIVYIPSFQVINKCSVYGIIWHLSDKIFANIKLSKHIHFW